MSNRLKTIIIDDEEPGRLNLQRMIRDYCPHLEVAGIFNSAEKAKQHLDHSPADVVFLDICMPKTNGFDFIHSYTEPPFAVVFVTAYQEYALRAIKASAVDYLLKPILPGELQQTQARLLKLNNTATSSLQALSENLASETPRKLVLYHSKGFNVVDTDHIVYLEADGNYTTFHLLQGRTLVVSRPIREFENTLDGLRFVRVHKSYLINLIHLEEYISEDAAYVLLAGGHRIEVSRRKAAFLFSRLAMFSGLRKNYRR